MPKKPITIAFKFKRGNDTKLSNSDKSEMPANCMKTIYMCHN